MDNGWYRVQGLSVKTSWFKSSRSHWEEISTQGRTNLEKIIFADSNAKSLSRKVSAFGNRGYSWPKSGTAPHFNLNETRRLDKSERKNCRKTWRPGCFLDKTGLDNTLNTEIQHIDKCWEAGLLWRIDNKTLPKSRINAERSLVSIERKWPNIHFTNTDTGNPHMGGCWKRRVKSVIIVSELTLREQATRQTLFADAVYSLDSRPLTHVSDESEDLTNPSPNDLLVRTPGVSHETHVAPSDFSDGKNLRRQWHIS